MHRFIYEPIVETSLLRQGIDFQVDSVQSSIHRLSPFSSSPDIHVPSSATNTSPNSKASSATSNPAQIRQEANCTAQIFAIICLYRYILFNYVLTSLRECMHAESGCLNLMWSEWMLFGDSDQDQVT